MNQGARYLLAMLLTAGLLYFTGVVVAHYAFREIAPNFTGDRAFNQKIKFLRDHPVGQEPPGIVIGSSMALSNVDTDALQKQEGRPWINLGMWGLSLRETLGVYRLFHSRFPVREVILGTQFFEMSDSDRNVMKMEPGTFGSYVGGHFGWVQEFAYRDLLEVLRQKVSWKAENGNPRDPESLVFTPTGAVPVYIYDGPGGPHRWSQFEDYVGGCRTCTGNLDELCRTVRGEKIPFTVFIPPVTHASRLRKPGVKKWYAVGRVRLRAAAEQCGGRVFDTAEVADFSDSCFFDFAHLNAQGMGALGQLFAQWRQGRLSGLHSVQCLAGGTPRVSQTANGG